MSPDGDRPESSGRTVSSDDGARTLATADSSLHARWAIVRRELASLRSEKTIVLALVIQLVIAGFSSFLVVGLVSLYDPTSVDGYETVVGVTGDDTDELLEAASGQESLEARHYSDRDDAHAAFESRRVSAVLDSSRDSEGRLAVRVTAPDGGLDATLLIVQLRELLESVERTERLANADRLEYVPIDVPDAADSSPYLGFTYTILIPLLCFLPVFISGSIAVDSLIEERQRGTLELLRVAPLSLGAIVDAKLVATAALAPLQAALWLLLLAFNGTAIANPTALVVFVASLSLLVVAVGVGISLAAPDRRQAQLLYSGAIVGALIVSSLLPEHPANTVAKFAIGSATGTTWTLLAVFVGVAIAVFLALRQGVGRLNPDAL